MYQAQLDLLTQFASERFNEELLKAKADNFARTGEVFEDDKSFEMRMASFLDYFLFDRILPDHQKSAAQIYLEKADHQALTPADLATLRGFTETRHSLWEVRKIAKELIRLRDVFTGKDIDVYERRQPAGLKKGDLIEARLIPCDGRLLFSSAFCFHPEEAKKTAYKEIKRLKKQEPSFSQREFVWALSRMRLKVDRYRNIAVKDIYAFDRKTI